MSRARALQFHLPRRLVLVRHGESAANVDPTVYSTTPDWKIPLTERGVAQALQCGKHLKENIVKDDKLLCYVSPYRRTRQTMDMIITQLNQGNILGLREDARIREQDVGNFQCAASMKQIWEERNRYGRFFYRFPNGENGADVCDRVSSFLATVFRERLEGDEELYADVNIVVVAHGLMMRLFIARWFKVPLPVFEEMHNPSNCSTIVLERVEDDDGRRLVLQDDAFRVLGIPHVNKELFDGRAKYRDAEWFAKVHLGDGWKRDV